MMDAHFHKPGVGAMLMDATGRATRFYGLHPWQATETLDTAAAVATVRAQLVAEPTAGVGEIGLDRLRTKAVTPAQRALFAAQLALAAELGRPVALHGAKCWGEVVAACAPYAGRIPAFLFHGFSRSTGLLPQIFALNGFVSLGPALLNDHAVNYRDMAKALPLDRVLLETDAEADVADAARDATLTQLVAALATLRGCAEAEILSAVAANLARF